MNININLVVRANSSDNAENIAMRELMVLAQAVAKRNGSSMGTGQGGAAPIASDAYQVNATVTLNGNVNVNDIMSEVQNIWMNKPEIVHSMFAVEEEKQEEPPVPCCAECGKPLPDDKDEGVYVNSNTPDEYLLCDHCLDCKIENGNVAYCDDCSYVDGLIENPVTHEANICPYCGEKAV